MIFLQTTNSLTKRLQQTTVTKCSRMTKVPHLLKEAQPTSHLPKPHLVSYQQLKVPMQTRLLRLQRRGGNQALVVPHMTAWTHLPALLYLQPPNHPNNIAAIPNHLPRPRIPVSLKRITFTAKWTSPTRSLPPPQVHLLPASHTLHHLPTSHTSHPPQPRGLSPHKRLAWIMFMQQLTIPRKRQEKARKVECAHTLTFYLCRI